MLRGPWKVTVVVLFVAMSHLGSCAEQPVVEPSRSEEVAPQETATVDLEGLRAMARRSPQETLAALDSHPMAQEATAAAEIRTLAQTTLFNAALKKLAAETDLRQAITVTLTLAGQPAPTNKRRLAQPVWGLIGKLERRVASDPAFTAAAVKRLAGSAILAELVGPQLGQRLETLLGRAEHLLITQRVDTLLTSRSFDTILAKLIAWSKGKVSPGQLSEAVGRVIASLEARSERGQGERLRADAIALSKRPALLTAAGPKGAQRLTELITQTGASTMTRWLKTIRSSRRNPVNAARHACEAERFARTEDERAALRNATAPVREVLSRQAQKEAMRYLNVIERRRSEDWRTMELPFLGAKEGPIGDFATQRERWLGANPRLDPRNGTLQVATAQLDLCEVSLALGLSRSDTTGVEVALSMCWHSERGNWFPCRPLTRGTKGAIVRP